LRGLTVRLQHIGQVGTDGRLHVKLKLTWSLL